METNQESNLGETLKRIRRNDTRRKIYFNPDTQEFEMQEADDPVEEGSQDATTFAEEGYA